MRRRELLAALGAFVSGVPSGVRAQQQGTNLPRIGMLWPGVSAPASPRMESFRRGLREQGYVDGRNVRVELRFAREGLQTLPKLAAELVQLNVDVICTFGDLTPKLAQEATRAIPIIAITDDIVGAGLVDNLSRPGANLTGLTILAPELSAKRLLLTSNAAQFLNVDLQVLQIRGREDLSAAFEAAKVRRAEALNVFSSPLLSSLSGEIIELAAEYKMPAIYQWREHVEAGGLISYGPNLGEMWRQCAVMVAKVLAGAKPGDMPVEQPSTIELVVNHKTAKALGLELPLPLLIRADDLIE